MKFNQSISFCERPGLHDDKLNRNLVEAARKPTKKSRVNTGFVGHEMVTECSKTYCSYSFTIKKNYAANRPYVLTNLSPML